MTSTAFEGGGNVLLEFEAGFNSDTALADVRAKVASAKSELPTDATDPSVNEVNLSLFPVISVALAGSLPERALDEIADAGAGRDRAGAGRAFRHPAGDPRRGRRGHRRADAPEKLRRVARSVRRRRRAGQQPGRGRRAGRRAGPLRRQGAGADPDAGGRAQDSGRGLQRGRRHAGRRRHGPARPSRTRRRSPGSTASRRW